MNKNRTNTPASKGKDYVSSAVPTAQSLKATYKNLSGNDRLVLAMVGTWILIMIFMLSNSTDDNSIELERYQDDVKGELPANIVFLIECKLPIDVCKYV